MLFRKKEIIAKTHKKHEDLEFQLMELETRCEAELEQAEEHFRNEQNLIEQNATIRQVLQIKMKIILSFIIVDFIELVLILFLFLFLFIEYFT